MAHSIVQYDKDLPEIEGRDKYARPDAYLRKKPHLNDFEVIEGRRPSKMLLVNKLRQDVDDWRDDGYPGATETTKRLFQYWFEEDHLMDDEKFRFYFCQREAIETLVYIIEILKIKDIVPLIKKFGKLGQTRLGTETDLVFQTKMDGTRQIRRYFDEINKDGVQDLPVENLRRYAIKMATGTGKTVVMAMFMVWSYFYKKFENKHDLSDNFLVIAPNVIVYQRLEKDFAGNKIFYNLPLIPSEWNFKLKVILRGEQVELDSSGNLILTNIQQILESKNREWTPKNAVEALLGQEPKEGNMTTSLFDKIGQLDDLVILNDEAHHVHDQDLAWNRTLAAFHEKLPKGLSVWLDFSATPKDQNGTFYPWVVCDYPLAQAVEDRIVKAPIIVHELNKRDPGEVTQENIIRKYGDWIINALGRWKEHQKLYSKIDKKPVLFIMCTKSKFADKIGEWLIDNSTTTGVKLKKDEVLIIHTDSEGEISQADLEKARDAARKIDEPSNKIKVIVSVLMLKEGWDVRNVTVILGLRPYSAKAGILPEQAIGRGLRLIQGIGPDSTQTLEVIGTEKFEGFVRELEQEGVGIKTVTKAPDPPIWIEPIIEKKKYDIKIPITKPIFAHNYKRFEDLNTSNLEPIFKQKELSHVKRRMLEMEFAMIGTVVSVKESTYGELPTSNEIISSITKQLMKEAKLSGVFSKLYPIVRGYLVEKCFSKKVKLDDEKVRNRLRDIEIQDSIAKYLARKISELVLERKELIFEDDSFKLSQTRPFSWRRKHIKATKSIFNYVSTFNDFESDFAIFLDKSTDILRFSSLAEENTKFKVDYLSTSGALKMYYPDFIAVQKDKKTEINWIIETKGRIYEDVECKDAAIKEWCLKISKMKDMGVWKYIRINQSDISKKTLFQMSTSQQLLNYLNSKKDRDRSD